MKPQQLSGSSSELAVGENGGVAEGAAFVTGDKAWLLVKETVLQPVGVASLVGFVLILLRETLAVVVDLLLLRNGKGRYVRFPRSATRNNINYYEDEQARQLRSSKMFFFSFRPLASVKQLNADTTKRLVRIVMLMSCVCFLLLPLSVPSAHLFGGYHEHVIFSKVIVALVAAAIVLSFLRLLTLGGFLFIQYVLVLIMTSSMFAQFCLLVSRNFTDCGDLKCLINRVYDKSLLTAEAKTLVLVITSMFIFYISRSFIYVYLLYSGVLGRQQSSSSNNNSSSNSNYQRNNNTAYSVHMDVGHAVPVQSPRRPNRNAGGGAAHGDMVQQCPSGMRYTTTTYRSTPQERHQQTGGGDRLASRMKSARAKGGSNYVSNDYPAINQQQPPNNYAQSPYMPPHNSPRTRPSPLPRSHTDHPRPTNHSASGISQQPQAYSLPHVPHAPSPAHISNMAWYQPNPNTSPRMAPMSPAPSPRVCPPSPAAAVAQTIASHRYFDNNPAVSHINIPTTDTSPEAYPWLYERGGTRYDTAAKPALPRHHLARLGSSPLPTSAPGGVNSGGSSPNLAPGKQKSHGTPATTKYADLVGDGAPEHRSRL
eukprot:Lankesteria_metandrocarpae@DN2072_c0_g1_i1.p1